MTFELYLNQNNTPLDVSEYITGMPTIQQRDDYAFSEGSCNLIYSGTNAALMQNIPPYTLCKINDRCFVCSSICKRYLIQQNTLTYYHEVSLLELTAIAETLVLGAKTWTNYNDSDSFAQTIQLIEWKYYRNYRFVYSFTLGGAFDYTFKIGTTLNDVFIEYGKRNQVRLYLSEFEWNEVSNKWEFTIASYSLNNYSIIDDGGVVFNQLRLELSQNVENYCKTLETVSSNVIDRNNMTRFNDVSCRTSLAAMNADNAEIQLPINFEAVTKFIINDGVGAYTQIICPDIITPTWILNHGGYSGAANEYTWIGTYQELIDSNTSYGGHDNIFLWIANERGLLTNLQYAQFTIIVNTAYNTYQCSEQDVQYDWTRWDDFVLEETEWNTLSVYDKPKYAYYKTGTNKIVNLNATFQDDIIHNILGQTSYNYINSNSHVLTDNAYIDENNYIGLRYHFYDDDPTHHTYTLIVSPIVDDMLLIDTKSNLPVNETNWKNSTRTYQNGANPIEFDSLIEDFKAQNKVLGTSEISIDYAIDAFKPMARYILPVFQYLAQFYVNSMVYTIYRDYMTLTINASKEPRKIADAIGVEYQYNPTLLPTQNIQTRPLYFEYKGNKYSEIDYNYNTGWDTFICMKFADDEYQTIKEVTLRVSLFKDKDGAYYLYAKMLDNYSAGKKSINVSGSNYQIVDVAYGDSDYRDFCIYNLNVVCVRHSLTDATSLALPDVSQSSLEPYEGIGVVTEPEIIFKDSRETLAFTIKIMPSDE